MGVYIREYTSAARDNRLAGAVSAPQEPGVDQTVITASGTSQQSAAFAKGTRLVRIHTTAGISILFGADPTATTAMARMAAGCTEYFGVEPGQKVAVIANV